MTRDRANKFCGKLVKLTFKKSWFNEATQEWIDEDNEYIGILEHCEYAPQKHLYILDDDMYLPTDNACWSANNIRTIKEINQ